MVSPGNAKVAAIATIPGIEYVDDCPGAGWLLPKNGSLSSGCR